MLNKKILMAGASAVAIFAAQAVMPGQAQATGFGDPNNPWNGFYVGAHIGTGQANWEGDYRVNGSDSRIDIGRLNTDGVLAGVHVGYNMMFQNYLLGIEGDFTWTDWQGTAKPAASTEELTAEVDSLYSVRARLGVTVDEAQRGLLYGTIGAAWVDADATLYPSGEFDSSAEAFDFSFNDVGLVVGGGFEWAATETVRVRAEGLYYYFDDSTNIFDSCGDACAADSGDNIKFDDVYVARVGASWYFNTPAAPVHVAHTPMK